MTAAEAAALINDNVTYDGVPVTAIADGPAVSVTARLFQFTDSEIEFGVRVDDIDTDVALYRRVVHGIDAAELAAAPPGWNETI